MKAARDSALAYGAAARRTADKAVALAAAVGAAKGAGAGAEQLRSVIEDAARRGGIDAADVPGEVWRAAGLKPPGA